MPSSQQQQQQQQQEPDMPHAYPLDETCTDAPAHTPQADTHLDLAAETAISLSDVFAKDSAYETQNTPLTFRLDDPPQTPSTFTQIRTQLRLVYFMVGLLAAHRVSNPRLVRSTYNHAAKTYHLAMRHGYDWPAEILPAALNGANYQGSSLKMIEFGCGNGKTSTQVLTRTLTNASRDIDIHLECIDFSPNMIEEARKGDYQGLTPTFTLGDTIKVLKEKQPHTQDLICGFGIVAYHFNKTMLHELLVEAERILSPQGILVFDSPADDPFNSKWFATLSRVTADLGLNVQFQELTSKKSNLAQRYYGVVVSRNNDLSLCSL